MLELAKKEAKQLRNSRIAPEHLLFGILEVEAFG
ncbi:Clp protease N-terminal domain-containing protein [Crocosphaera subtropica]